MVEIPAYKCDQCNKVRLKKKLVVKINDAEKHFCDGTCLENYLGNYELVAIKTEMVKKGKFDTIT